MSIKCPHDFYFYCYFLLAQKLFRILMLVSGSKVSRGHAEFLEAVMDGAFLRTVAVDAMNSSRL